MRPDAFRTPCSFRGRWVELVPLARSHAAQLWETARRPEVMRYLRIGVPRVPADLDLVVDELLALQTAGTDLPFTTRFRPTGEAIGMTRYLRIDRPNESVEIGGTWLDPAFWRTPVNTESKLLLLRHAFEGEGAHRVQLQTDSRNERSQTAIARLGAVREGVLREDALLPDGYRRSSVMFSILATEWPAVRTRLESMLERPWTPPARPPPAPGA